MKTIFRVYELKNIELLICGDSNLVGEIPGTKRDARNWVARGGVIPTHMGEFRKQGDGYFYFTTIGRTYAFVRSRVR